MIAARTQKGPSGNADTAKVRQQPGDASIKGDRSLKRKRPAQPSMSMSSAIKGSPHHNLTSLLYNLRNHCGRMCDFITYIILIMKMCALSQNPALCGTLIWEASRRCCTTYASLWSIRCSILRSDPESSCLIGQAGHKIPQSGGLLSVIS